MCFLLRFFLIDSSATKQIDPSSRNCSLIAPMDRQVHRKIRSIAPVFSLNSKKKLSVSKENNFSVFSSTVRRTRATSISTNEIILYFFLLSVSFRLFSIHKYRKKIDSIFNPVRAEAFSLPDRPLPTLVPDVRTIDRLLGHHFNVLPNIGTSPARAV